MLHQLLLSHAVQTVYADPVLLARPNVPTASDQLPEQCNFHTVFWPSGKQFCSEQVETAAAILYTTSRALTTSQRNQTVTETFKYCKSIYSSLAIADTRYYTSIVTGRHRRPKRKLRAGYRAPSLNQTSCVVIDCKERHIFHRSVVSHTFSALCVYSKSGHHHYPLGYLCAKFRFCHGPHCWASPWRKIAYSITHSITQLIWCPGNWSIYFGIDSWLNIHVTIIYK